LEASVPSGDCAVVSEAGAVWRRLKLEISIGVSGSGYDSKVGAWGSHQHRAPDSGANFTQKTSGIE
jgi:hypothetical protein